MKLLLALALIPISAAAQPATGFRPEALRVEYLENPMGIDVAQPRLSWRLAPLSQGLRQSAWQIQVASSSGPLNQGKPDVWDSGKVASPETAFIPYAGPALSSGQRLVWRVRAWDGAGRPSAWSVHAAWSMGLLNPSDWTAPYIGAPPQPNVKPGTPQPFPWLRKTFHLDRKPSRATAYVNPLGYYELYVNGAKVDDHLLSPAVTDYSKRNLYVTHDITPFLRAGANVVALWLGRGWYVRGHPGVIHDGPLVRARFDIEQPAGSPIRIETGTDWKVRFSPLTPLGRGTAFGDYGGERYDAALELPNWNSPAFDDSAWQPAAVFTPPPAATTAQMVQPNREIETLRPARIDETSPGVFTVDMGRNYVGWFEVKLPPSTAAGRQIRIEFADTAPSGARFMTQNQRDEYVTRAGAGQTIRSRFNYHGFRWARITGLDRAPAAADIAGRLIRTAYARSASFESSDDLLNRIWRTAAWTYENLTLGGYVVDCPTRERLGYGGDAGTSIETGLFNFDTGALYSSWAANWRDAQAPNGDVPYTAPNYPDQGGGGPMWSGFVVTLPWHIYLQYGDQRVLETNYDMIRRWLSFADSKTKDGLIEHYVSVGISMPQWNYLGDWVAPRRGREEPDIARNPVAARFINNTHYLYTLQIASRIATILGKPEDAKLYSSRATALASKLHSTFFNAADNTYATGQQPYLAFPLLTGIVPAGVRPAVLKNLEETIRVKDAGHINAGMHGAYFLLKFLMEEDRNDLIYEFTSKRTFPSWGYMLEQDATTFWESWSGQSRIHDTLISIGSWFIQGIGGIRLDEQSPGFSHFILKPARVGNLTFARSTYRSIHGEIVSNWRVANALFHYEASIPPSTTATLHLPAAPVSAPPRGARFLRVENGRSLYELGPGNYSFTAKP